MKVEMTEKETFGAIRRSVEKEPYARSLGIRLEELRLGWAVAEMEFSGDMKDLLGTAHGGALFSSSTRPSAPPPTPGGLSPSP